MSKLKSIIVILVLTQYCYAQSLNLDSLLRVYKTEKSTDKKYEASLYIIKELAWRNLDSAKLFLDYAKKWHKNTSNKKIQSYYYYINAYIYDKTYKYDSTILFCDSCLRLCNEKSLMPQRADCYFSKAVALYYKGDGAGAAACFKKAIPIFIENGKRKKALNGYSNLIGIYQSDNLKDTCLNYFRKALLIADTVKDCSVLSTLYSNISALYDKSHNYQNVLKYLLMSLKYAEKTESPTALILTYIGSAYMNTNNYQKAESYIRRGYVEAYRSEDPNDILEASSIYGLYYQNKNDFKRALVILDSAKKYCDEENIMSASALLYRGLSWSYAELGDYQKATIYADKNIKLRKESEDNNALSEALEYKAHIFYKQKKYPEAIKIYMEGLELAEKIDNKIFIKNTYQALARIYDETKDYKKANDYLKKYTVLNDSITSYINATINSELEEKYASEKKQAEIKILEKESKLKSEELRNSSLELKSSNQQKSFLVVGLALVGLLLGFAVYSFIQKQKANTLIIQQKKEVELQKELVDEKQKEILDSIHYAKRIQSALLANKEFVDSYLPHNFILFQPKDIVSGDFYWATEHDNKFYLAVCDSTGHGVPGAFMSLLNMGFLSEAIKEKNIAEPHKVFDYVRKRLIDSIGNEGQKDGMDAILLCVDKKTKTITYAAANNEPILIRDNEVIELPKDRMPVGKGEKMDAFTLQTIHLQSGDDLYLYTDGYADQFGGPKGKKFKYKALNGLLQEICKEDANKQKEILYDQFNSWKGDLEQVDDVCIIGIKF